MVPVMDLDLALVPVKVLVMAPDLVSLAFRLELQTNKKNHSRSKWFHPLQ